MKAKTKPQARTADVVLSELVVAKAAESSANKVRVALEEELIKVVGYDKIEGAQTFNIGDYKVTITGKLNRKVENVQGLHMACLDLKLSPDLHPIRTRVEVDQTALRYLANNEVEIFTRLAKFVVTEPSKTAVSISRKL
jgi:hypothetical protein